MASKGNGTIRRCGLVGVGVVLLEEVCHCGVGFEVSYAQDTPSVSVHFLLPMDRDTLTLGTYLPAYHRVLAMMTKPLKL